MKKTIAIILASILLCFSVSLETGAAGDYSYTNTNGEITITKYSGSDSVVEIPAVIDGCPVTAIGDGAFRFNTAVTKVRIPDSVKEIRTRAFDYCSGLTEITIGEGVTYVGEFAFSQCVALEEIILSDSITEFGNCVFFGDTALKRVTLPKGLEKISVSMFSGCTGLESIDISDSVKVIGAGAFGNCTSLAYVKVPEGVTKLDRNVFNGCTGLKTVEIPGSVTSIDSSAFSYIAPEIKGKKGSFAETFAISNGFAFTETEEEPKEEHVAGDVTCDGAVNAKDANILKQIIAGSLQIEEGSNIFKVCDLNGDNILSAKDANILVRIIAGAEIN